MIKMGCFGSVVAFAPKQEVCQKCPVRKQCAAEVFSKEEDALSAIERKETVRETNDATLFVKERHDINNLPDAAYHKVKRFFKRRKTYTVRTAKGLPVTRAEKDHQAMVENGIQFDQIKMRQNPFKGGSFYQFMAHTVDCLLDLEFVAAKDVSKHFKDVGFGTSDSGRLTMARRALKILELANVAKNENQEGTYCLS